jgi:hypothetical protein
VVERIIGVVEPVPPLRAPSPSSLAEDEEEVESDDVSDDAAPPLEVFMPPGDMEAARRMAVVYIDSLPPFTSPAGACAEAIFAELPGLHVTMVGSSLGDVYARFLSEEDRELALLHQPFHCDGATFRLVPEEAVDRIPSNLKWFALVLARRVPVENPSHLNAAAAFSCFGETLEVDAASLSGTDCSAVRAVVCLRHAQFVPAEILLTLRKVRAWRVEDSYNSEGEYVPFFSPVPPPLFNRRLGRLPLVPGRLPPAPAAENGSRGDRDIDNIDGALLPHEALLAFLDSVASSPPSLGPLLRLLPLLVAHSHVGCGCWVVSHL